MSLWERGTHCVNVFNFSLHVVCKIVKIVMSICSFHLLLTQRNKQKVWKITICVAPPAKPSTPAQPQISPVTMDAVWGSATCATTQMTVVTTVMSTAAPTPHVTPPPSSPAPMDAASVQPSSAMAKTTAVTTPLPTKSTAVSDERTDQGT